MCEKETERGRMMAGCVTKIERRSGIEIKETTLRRKLVMLGQK